jgi:CheY-like chemotaxis protein
MNKVKSPVEIFLAANRCLVVEPSSSFINNIVMCLTSLGAPKSNIDTAVRFEDAYRIVDEKKPTLIITEYQIGDHFGLTLIEKIDALVGENNRVAMLATKNANDTVVAEAAEEQVDAYILKPFSMGDFKKKLEECIAYKAKPTPYKHHITKGKELFDAKNLAEAKAEFARAKKESSKPSLAHYYMGEIYKDEKRLDDALTEFQAGLKVTPLHYKCIMGCFDILFTQGKYAEAYALVPQIKSKYPISPQRLGNVLICAVYSSNFQDLGQYYKTYTSLMNRPPELVKIATAAFKAAARLMLKSQTYAKAVEYYDMGLVVSGLSVEFLEVAIRDLLKSKQAKAAADIYRKYPRHLANTEIYALLGFYIDCQSLSPNDAFESGKRVLSNITKGEPDFYRELVDVALASGRRIMAEDIVNRAVGAFPELRAELYAKIEDPK